MQHSPPELSKNDLVRLSEHLAPRLEGFGNEVTATKFAKGQSNPTYLLVAGKSRYVLRKKPPGALLRSAHAIEREYQVMDALKHTDVPVPEVFHLCEDDSVVGTPFFVMEYVQGRTFEDPELPGQVPAVRKSIYSAMGGKLAALHSVDIQRIGLTSFGKPEKYFDRQIFRWTEQYKRSVTARIPAMDALMRELPGRIPPDDGQIALVHGDYRIDNLIFELKLPAISAIVDWELSTVGHPFADLAYQCMHWQLPHGSLIPGLGGCDRKFLGIPTEPEYIRLYCNARNISPPEDWGFYLAFAGFRFAAILQGVYKRATQGNASHKDALAVGQMARSVAELAVRHVRR